MCKCLLESLRYSNSLGEICELYIVGFPVEVISAEEMRRRGSEPNSGAGLRYGLDNTIHF
jgi:hypothetical protein